MSGYNFNLKWKGTNVQVGAGDNFSADIDTIAVFNALTGAGAVATNNFGPLMTLSAASLATCLAVMGAKKAWSWLSATEPPNKDVLKLSAPGDKKKEFDRLIEDGELEKKMQETLENPRQSIRNLFDSNASQEELDELVRKLKGIKLSSLTKCTGGDGDQVGLDVMGNFEAENRNQLDIVAPAEGGGNLIGMRVNKGATAKIKNTGGIHIIGGRQGVHNRAIDAMTGNRVKVLVMFDDLSPTYEGYFPGDRRIHDVVVAIKEERGKVYEIKHCKTKDPITRDTTLESLKKTNDLTNLLAFLQS